MQRHRQRRRSGLDERIGGQPRDERRGLRLRLDERLERTDDGELSLNLKPEPSVEFAVRRAVYDGASRTRSFFGSDAVR